MNIDLKQFPEKIMPVLQKILRYKTMIFFILLSLIFGYLVFSINNYAKIEPTEDAVNEKLTTVQRPKIDEKAIKKIQQLEDQNVQVQSLFKNARDNPFSEQ